MTAPLAGEDRPTPSAKSKKSKSALPKLIDQYYADLKDLAHQNVLYKMSTRTAFHNLLAGAGKPHKWTLIPELERKALGKTAGGAAKAIGPDGTFKDEMNLVRGYWDETIDKWAIFHYVYGLLHHPGYREKFADNLKRELPRIPFAPDFRAFAEAGKKLAKLHLDYESETEWELEFQETPGEPLSYRVADKMRLTKDKARLIVNKSLTLSGIPPEAFEYRLGNRSALEWVIDQYQVSTDKRSSITSDPNREDDEKYIVRLVGQVITASVETMKIVNTLPTTFSESGMAL